MKIGTEMKFDTHPLKIQCHQMELKIGTETKINTANLKLTVLKRENHAHSDHTHRL